MKINKKYSHLVFSVIMGSIMTFIMTLAMTFVNGTSNDFLLKWMRSWGVAVIIVIPLIYTLAPKIRRFVESITQK